MPDRDSYYTKPSPSCSEAQGPPFSEAGEPMFGDAIADKSTDFYYGESEEDDE